MGAIQGSVNQALAIGAASIAGVNKGLESAADAAVKKVDYNLDTAQNISRLEQGKLETAQETEAKTATNLKRATTIANKADAVAAEAEGTLAQAELTGSVTGDTYAEHDKATINAQKANIKKQSAETKHFDAQMRLQAQEIAAKNAIGKVDQQNKFFELVHKTKESAGGTVIGKAKMIMARSGSDAVAGGKK